MREAFNFIDRTYNGSLFTSDFREFLAKYEFYATDRELNGLMYRFDTNKDNKITLKEFLE